MAKRTRQRKDPLLERLGARIREIRKKKGLSQERVALAAGLDRSYVGGVERGERNVAIVNLNKIAKALNVSLPTLLQGI
jgi:transcriptional regulator with XRE-family HTH domain